jgi:hypothetical protein
LAQRGRKRRKRRRRSAGSADPAPAGARRSRSQIKDDEAREKLVPLREGERPAAVTVAAVVTLALVSINLIAYLVGLEVRGERVPALSIGIFTALMLAMAWGLWRARYWAVLGMEAILGMVVVFFSLALMTAENLTTVLIVLAVVAPAGTLFWFLVKAMARIQMPERR